MSDIQIPNGYVMDADGNLIKEDNLSPVEQLENKVIDQLFPMAIQLHDEIARFKYISMKMVEDMVRELAEQHKLKKFEKIKGNIQLTSICGKRRIRRSINDLIENNSKIEIARQKFDLYAEALKAKAEGNENGEFIKAYFTQKDGKYPVTKLIELCNKPITHPLFVAAATALRESLFVSGSKAYLNFYYREKSDGEWVPLPLQFSSVSAAAPKEETQEDTQQESKTAA